MTDLPQRLREIADTLDGCEWYHPLLAAQRVREAAARIEAMEAEIALLNQNMETIKEDRADLLAIHFAACEWYARRYTMGDLTKTLTKILSEREAAEESNQKGGE